MKQIATPKNLSQILCALVGSFVGFSASEVLHQGNTSSGERTLPQSHFTLTKEHFVIGYDGRLKQPAYVYETVTAEQLIGDVSRKDSDFNEETFLPEAVRVHHSDYYQSGYDRGHLSPASNHKNSQNAMQESFLYSNISPQTPQFNRGYWRKVEKKVQQLAAAHGRVIAVTGPLFLAKKGSDGKRYVTYEVIGESAIAAPTHFFKVIATPQGTHAYVVENGPVDADSDLETFAVPISEVERAAGLAFPTL